MSRSKKKPWEWISKRFDEKRERAFRKRIKQKCHDVEIDFDPDADWEELQLREKDFSGCGTRCGFPVVPKDSDDTWMHKEYKKSQRK